MNLDDARTVLEWMHWDWECLLPHPDGVTFDEVDPMSGNSGFAFRLDANWIFRTLIPALEERLKCGEIAIWFKTEDDEDHLVTLECEEGRADGYGPTFEAAVISAAAKAVRNV